MRGVHTRRVSGVTVTAAQDFFEITAPANGIVVIHEVVISQTSDVTDAQDEIIAVQFIRGIGATAGSGGSTPGAGKTETGSAASGASVKANNTTQMVAGGGSLENERTDAMNVRAGYSYIPTPETRIVLSPSEKLVVTLPAPNDALTMGGTIVWEEMGG